MQRVIAIRKCLVDGGLRHPGDIFVVADSFNFEYCPHVIKLPADPVAVHALRADVMRQPEIPEVAIYRDIKAKRAQQHIDMHNAEFNILPDLHREVEPVAAPPPPAPRPVSKAKGS